MLFTGIVVFVLAAVYSGWRAAKAEVFSTASTWVDRKAKPGLVEPLLAEAVRLMPHERYYRRLWMFHPATLATTEIQISRGAPATYATVNSNLLRAEARARENMALWPRDPWSVFSVANYLQLRSLMLLRPNDPAGGANAAEEAQLLFARAFEMMPNQPLFLPLYPLLKIISDLIRSIRLR